MSVETDPAKVLATRAACVIWQALTLVLTSLGAALAGCQHADLARQESRARLASLAQPVRIWGNTERTRPADLRRTLDHAAWYFEHQAESLQNNLAAAERHIERDVRRGEYLRDYSEEALEILYGHPERIERNAIILFF